MVQIFCAKAAIAFCFYFRIFDLKDSKNKLILIVSGTFLQILGAILLTVLGILEKTSLWFRR